MSDPVAKEIKRYRKGEIGRNAVKSAFKAWSVYPAQLMWITMDEIVFRHERGVMTIARGDYGSKAY